MKSTTAAALAQCRQSSKKFFGCACHASRRGFLAGGRPNSAALHYDTANATHPAAMAALQKLVPMSQVTYGTDTPYFPLDQINSLRKLGLRAADLDAIASGNAERLIPRLKP